MQTSSQGLWRNPNFVKLWSGQTISLLGSSVTALAIPLAAATQLAATPFQMGVMQMAQYLPFLLFGLIAGVWVDRLPRRPVLIFTDLGRAVALALIPIAAFNGWLGMEVLYLVSFVVGTFNLLFEAAYAAILPSLVTQDKLAEGNSRLQASGAFAEIAGPGLAGWIVQVFTAAYAILGDAVSFLGSAVLMLFIKVKEAPRLAREARPPILHDLKEGLGMVLRNPYIRPLALCSGSANIFINMHLAVYVIYLTREVGFTPGEVGLLYSIASVGGFIGAISSTRIARWLGLGRAIVAECLAVGVAAIAVPLIATLGTGSLPLLALAHAIWSFWLPVYIVNAASLRQVVTPNHLLGRVTASSRFISWGAAAVGFLIGGIVAESIGLWLTLVIAGVGLLASSLWIILSKVSALEAMPPPAEPVPEALVG